MFKQDECRVEAVVEAGATKAPLRAGRLSGIREWQGYNNWPGLFCSLFRLKSVKIAPVQVWNDIPNPMS